MQMVKRPATCGHWARIIPAHLGMDRSVLLVQNLKRSSRQFCVWFPLGHLFYSAVFELQVGVPHGPFPFSSLPLIVSQDWAISKAQRLLDVVWPIIGMPVYLKRERFHGNHNRRRLMPVCGLIWISHWYVESDVRLVTILNKGHCFLTICSKLLIHVCLRICIAERSTLWFDCGSFIISFHDDFD